MNIYYKKPKGDHLKKKVESGKSIISGWNGIKNVGLIKKKEEKEAKGILSRVVE